MVQCNKPDWLIDWLKCDNWTVVAVVINWVDVVIGWHFLIAVSGSAGWAGEWDVNEGSDVDRADIADYGDNSAGSQCSAPRYVQGLFCIYK